MSTQHQQKKLREANRNYTVGQPAKFTPLQKLCRRVGQANIFQLRRWAKSWPRRFKLYARAHRDHCRILPAEESPWIGHMAVLAGALQYLEAEAAARPTGKPNTCDSAKYELDTVLSRA